ncbi:hypothetical protein J6590_018432 [Homalodisca vitripennis]|nr:hypothetical protein J6590_018432 [Homalodisca vitripennis]
MFISKVDIASYLDLVEPWSVLGHSGRGTLDLESDREHATLDRAQRYTLHAEGDYTLRAGRSGSGRNGEGVRQQKININETQRSLQYG